MVDGMKKKTPVYWIGSYAKPHTGMILLLTLISGSIALGFILLALMASRVIDCILSGNFASLPIQLLCLCGIVALQAVFNIISSNLRIRVSGKLEIAMKQSLFSVVLNRNYSDITQYHSGELINRLTSDVEIIVNGIVTLIPQTVSLGTKLVAGLTVLFLLDYKFAAAISLFGLASAFFSRFYSKKYKQLHKEVQRTNGIVRAFMQENIENLTVIKSFANEKPVLDHLAQAQQQNYQAKVKRNAVSNAANTAFYAAFTTGYYAALAWGAFQVVGGGMSVGMLTAFLQILEQIKAPFRNVSGLLPQYYAMIASAERLQELEAVPAEKETVSPQISAYNTFQRLAMKNVSFSYGEETIFSHMDFQLETNEKVAIIGPSGIGKSTLVKLLLGLFPCQEGEAYVQLAAGDDKLPLGKGTRQLFAYVPQGNYLFSGTVRETVSFYGREIEEEAMRAAAETACIWDFISSLPEKWDTRIGERGLGLSEGQAQRLAVARALLSNAPVLLLDECTSALDRDTELQLLENLKQVTRTVLFISHKPKALKYCDRVLKIEDHKFVEVKECGCK